jgi:hypothetical protein
MVALGGNTFMTLALVVATTISVLALLLFAVLTHDRSPSDAITTLALPPAAQHPEDAPGREPFWTQTADRDLRLVSSTT